MKQTIITNSYEETQKLGSDFARKIVSVSAQINSGIVLALYGDLGSGKTTFVQGLAKSLGVKSKIISPTFIIMRSYQIILNSQFPTCRRGRSILNYFYHIDLYRIQDEKDIEELGLIELLDDPQNIIAIEWPEKIEKILSKKRINIYFEYMDDNKRKITYEK